MLKPAFLRYLLPGLLALMLSACGPEDEAGTSAAVSNKTYNWKMVTGFPGIAGRCRAFCRTCTRHVQWPY